MDHTNDVLTEIKSVMCDFYGTVVDMQGGLIETITPYLQSKGYSSASPSRVVTWWRRTHFENSMIDALLHQAHTPYRHIAREALEYTLERAAIDHTVDEVVHLVSQLARLEPFPEVVDALNVIKGQGLQLAILSNGDPDMLADGVSYSGTTDLWDHVISTAEADSFKPHAVTYVTAARLAGLQPHETLFVANHAFDCVGAKAAGMNTAFINRRARPFGNSRYGPDLVVENFSELAKTISAHYRAPGEPV